jgi:hypothetical protein
VPGTDKGQTVSCRSWAVFKRAVSVPTNGLSPFGHLYIQYSLCATRRYTTCTRNCACPWTTPRSSCNCYRPTVSLMAWHCGGLWPQTDQIGTIKGRPDGFITSVTGHRLTPCTEPSVRADKIRQSLRPAGSKREGAAADLEASVRFVWSGGASRAAAAAFAFGMNGTR